ncbi:NIPSNAP family protein [Kribbella sp. NPDC050241]|jgi:NIPSNAP protein|uniref:NIPSNAP family protein n=1 Tax=Kribbella sp. NPDC050241 TaxID=3364115 RepID=UPI0037900BA2
MIAELRYYTIAPGRTEDLFTQFREVSLPLFERHGISAHGPWLRTLHKGEQLVYILEFEDEGDKERRWTAFRNDPDWVAVQRAGAGQPPLVAGIDSVALER